MAAPVMSDDLRQLLLANMVPQECVDLLQKDGCINLKLFSKWAPDRAAMQSLVLDKVPSHKTSVQALASLLQTHDEATSIVTEMTKRTSAGLDPSSMDEPLLHAVQQALEAKFVQKYSWQLEPKYQPSNSVLGRIKREFDKNAPTIFNVCRVKTVFTSNKIQEPKRRRVGTGITLTFEEDLDDEDPQALKYRQIMHKYNVLALAWAIAGNFEVTYEGSKCDFASWQQTHRYVRTLREKTELLMDHHSEESVVRYLLSVEEQIRGFAVEYCRRTPSVPFGAALDMALKENRELWQDFKYLLSGNKASSSIRSVDTEDLPVESPLQAPATSVQDNAPPKKTPSSPGKEGSKATSQQPSLQGLATATHTSGGSQICKSWNDSRGCPKPCASGKAHVCDIVLLKTGAVCGRSDHNRRGHNPLQHGVVAPRQ